MLPFPAFLFIYCSITRRGCDENRVHKAFICLFFLSFAVVNMMCYVSCSLKDPLQQAWEALRIVFGSHNSSLSEVSRKKMHHLWRGCDTQMMQMWREKNMFWQRRHKLLTDLKMKTVLIPCWAHDTEASSKGKRKMAICGIR